MAGISNINESNVSNLTDEQLSRMDTSQLDKVLELLDGIKQRMGYWTTEQNRVAASAASYRRELEKTNSLLRKTKPYLVKFLIQRMMCQEGLEDLKLQLKAGSLIR